MTDLDLTRPADNLHAFGKTWGTFGDEPVIGVFHGSMYAWQPGQKLRPLFGYVGTGVTKCRIEANGNLRMRGKETGFFTDLATGEVLETWDNPYSGRTVEAFHFLNDKIGGELTEQMPVLTVGDHHDEGSVMNDSVESAPFVLPWQVFGDEVLLEWDYAHEYPNPVDPVRFPHSSTGERINPSEHFTIYTSMAELGDRDLPSAHFRAGFSRLSPWWPWMRMGPDVPGVLFGRLFSRTCRRGADDIPPKIRSHIDRTCPEMLEFPDDWDLGPILSTWEAYARATPPER